MYTKFGIISKNGMDYDIEYFESDGREKNAKEFIFGYLKKKNRILFKKCLSWITKLKDKSNHGEPRTSKLDAGIFELKVDSARIAFCFGKEKIIFLLSGFIKTSNKTKSKDLNMAKKLYIEFLGREGRK